MHPLGCEFGAPEDCHQDILIPIKEIASSDLDSVGRAGHHDADHQVLVFFVEKGF
jgi:hypothetical protein